MRQFAGSLKLELAQYRELELFASFGSDVDDITQRILDRGQRLMLLLTQRPHSPLPISVQVLVISSGTLGALDNASLDSLELYESYIINWLKYTSLGRYISFILNNNRTYNFDLRPMVHYIVKNFVMFW